MDWIRRPLFWVVLFAVGLALIVRGGPTSPRDKPLNDGLTEVLVYGPFPDHPGEGDEQLHKDETATASYATAEQDEDVLFAEGESDVGGPTEEDLAALTDFKPTVSYYVVRSGDTLSGIAARYGITPDTILAANDVANANMLRVGQRLKILSVDGALHHVQRGESLWVIARLYGVDLDEIVSVNDLKDPSRLMVSDEVFIPGSQAAQIGSSLRSERLVGPDGRLLKAFSWPVTGRISSGYGARWGRFHHGLDVAVPTGTHVKAAAAGRVSFAGWNGGYGNLVVIDHGDRVETRYAHNSRIVVKVGQRVRRGDLIAYSGNTGRSTGPHVHFEIRRKGQSVDPMKYLR